MITPPNEVPTREQLDEWLRDLDVQVLLADGFEAAFAGLVRVFGRSAVACYDTRKMVNILMFRDGMTYEEAEEFLEYNVYGAYVGDLTPAFLTPFSDVPFWVGEERDESEGGSPVDFQNGDF